MFKNLEDRDNKVKFLKKLDNYLYPFFLVSGVLSVAYFKEPQVKEFIDNLEKDKLKKYLTYVPFDKKERLFTFTTQITDTAIQPSQENLIKGLGATTNQNTNKLTWNDTNGNNEGAYISKAKLN